MDDQNADGGFIVEMRVYGFDSKDAARLYVEALTSAFCAMPESAPYASTTGIVTSEEHLAEMNVEALQALVAELELGHTDKADAWGAVIAAGKKARRDAFEEAAKVADQWATDQQRQFGNGGPAAAIRDLAEKG